MRGDTYLKKIKTLIKEEIQEILNISCDLAENYSGGESGKLSEINYKISELLKKLK